MRNEVATSNERGQFRTADLAETSRAVWVLCRSVADWYVLKGPKTPAETAMHHVRYSLALVGDTKTRST